MFWTDENATAGEAVRLYRALADARSDAFTADLARSLNALAAMLRDLGRIEIPQEDECRLQTKDANGTEAAVPTATGDPKHRIPPTPANDPFLVDKI